MAAVIAVRSRLGLNKHWQLNCRAVARAAAGSWKRPGSRSNTRPSYHSPRWNGSGFAFMWAGASVADGGCRAGIRARPRMQWAERLRNWERGNRNLFTYEKLVEQIRGSPGVAPDETGWKVGGRLWWMWAFSNDKLTVYSIQPGRGYEQASAILGPDFDGFLVRDGWAVYRRFTQRQPTKRVWRICSGAAAK